MKLTFLGANHEVTGSCTMLEAAGQRFLIDYGMEQGKNVYENQPLPVAPGEIDFVLITHAHIDHTGLLPLLAHNGFRGRIYATIPTVELCGIMLRDSAHIQEFEAEWKNRKGKRSGAEPVEPMYTIQDAEAACRLFHNGSFADSRRTDQQQRSLTDQRISIISILILRQICAKCITDFCFCFLYVHFIIILLLII